MRFRLCRIGAKLGPILFYSREAFEDKVKDEGEDVEVEAYKTLAVESALLCMGKNSLEYAAESKKGAIFINFFFRADFALLPPSES